ncbi:MAG TPA: hypothetical protein VD997_02615 [Phycisphaerales bacterium]|nr:hypothetical protein [Phycisphaerales bacterium]
MHLHVAAAAIVGFLAAHGQPTDERAVEFKIAVRDETGAGIPDVPFVATCNGSAGDNDICSTGPDGSGFSDIAVVPRGPATLVVAPFDPNFLFDPFCENAEAAAFRALTLKRSFNKWYEFPIADTEKSISGVITLPRAVSATGIVLKDGEPVGPVYASRSRGRCLFLSKNNRFSVGGFKRGERGTYFIALEKSPRVAAQGRVIYQDVTVPADASYDTVITLPDVQWPAGPTVLVPVEVNVQNFRKAPMIYGGVRKSVTLLSADCDQLYTFPIGPEGGVFMDMDGQKAPPKLPPGTYYLAMGDLLIGPADLVFEALRRYGAASLDKAGYPKMVVSAGDKEPSCLTLDAESVWAKMKALPQP